MTVGSQGNPRPRLADAVTRNVTSFGTQILRTGIATFGLYDNVHKACGFGVRLSSRTAPWRANSFHEKAGRGQDTLRFFLSVSLFPFS